MGSLFKTTWHRFSETSAPGDALACRGMLRFRAETVPFPKAIDAALKHSGTMGIAAAEEAHARASLAQARDAYIPQAILGSGLGASFGFPLTLEGSAPSILNFNTQSMVLNFPQREYIRSARIPVAGGLDADARQARPGDSGYGAHLLSTRPGTVEAEDPEPGRRRRAQTEFITTQRVNQGIDSQLELKKSQLNSARVRMRLAEIARRTSMCCGSIFQS